MPPKKTPLSGELKRANATAEIEAFTRALTDAVNRRDWNGEILTRLANPNFYSSPLYEYPVAHTWQSHIDNFKAIIAQAPGYHMGIKNLYVELNGSMSSAEAFVTYELSGKPPGLTIESLVVLTWRHCPSGWRAVSHVNMRHDLGDSYSPPPDSRPVAHSHLARDARDT